MIPIPARRAVRARPRLHAVRLRSLVVWGAVALAGCSPADIVGNGQLPSDVPDPSSTQTAAGAVQAYYGALLNFRDAFGGGGLENGTRNYIVVSGLLADELRSSEYGAPIGTFSPTMYPDSRTLLEYRTSDNEPAGSYLALYRQLQKTRGQIQEARGLLGRYGGDSLRALSGHLQAVEGYTAILLADLYCSGIPLSTVDFEGDFTYRPGSTTAEVYEAAVALFDSAAVLATDSVRFVNLSRIGKGRALLGLGRFAEAAQAVAAIPDGFTYDVLYAATSVTGNQNTATNFAQTGATSVLWEVTAADLEGGRGLDYRSSGDPRTRSTAIGTASHGEPLYHPNKYSRTGNSPITLAGWVEARLIEAEAALAAGDLTTWLGKLNHLRRTAIAPALPDTTDPGTDAARVDLLFRERAFWLYLTGQRQGDLRRLIRQYGRTQDQVYPGGIYRGGPGAYGTDVNAPIPSAERLNPLFTGCFHRGA